MRGVGRRRRARSAAWRAGACRRGSRVRSFGGRTSRRSRTTWRTWGSARRCASWVDARGSRAHARSCSGGKQRGVGRTAGRPTSRSRRLTGASSQPSSTVPPTKTRSATSITRRLPAAGEGTAKQDSPAWQRSGLAGRSVDRGAPWFPGRRSVWKRTRGARTAVPCRHGQPHAPSLLNLVRRGRRCQPDRRKPAILGRRAAGAPPGRRGCSAEPQPAFDDVPGELRQRAVPLDGGGAQPVGGVDDVGVELRGHHAGRLLDGCPVA